MRIGVAGVGRIGAMHAANLASLDTVQEVLLFDQVAGRAGRVAAALGERASVVDEFDALLAASDGVLLATPTSTHSELLRRCVIAGVTTLCEKPIASSLGDMYALVADVEAAGVDVLVGFQRRFDPAIVELHRRLRAGEVGTVYLVRALGNDASPPDAGYLPTSGGIFRDLLIHDLDVVPWLLDEPVVSVFASGSVLVDEVFAEGDDVDNAVAVLSFASGVHAVLTGGRHDALGYDHRIEVFGSLDSLTVGLDERTPLTSLEPNGPMVAADAYPGFSQRFRRAYRNEMSTFVDVVVGGVENPSPARDSLVSLELAHACERSRRTGSPVRLQPEAGLRSISRVAR
jgi:myo-inositol 2-dehydrogenase/D-chiro-inositol 1-dehydrogenase